ncbi:hypothetical protein GUJ93_ZPchr0004g40152 [Zizania palustris]|uniref:Uncharacterized protein n=1 Tax=Zizania palustris TaxID=103762 RepID=A0A8J5S6G5_ZIZPA|nr:hypothetical protein GUJ93_ZPchr0004g40152 [Zizania palustris]
MAPKVGTRPRGPLEPAKSGGSPESHRLYGGHCVEVLAPYLVENLKHSMARNPSGSLCEPDQSTLRNTEFVGLLFKSRGLILRSQEVSPKALNLRRRCYFKSHSLILRRQEVSPKALNLQRGFFFKSHSLILRRLEVSLKSLNLQRGCGCNLVGLILRILEVLPKSLNLQRGCGHYLAGLGCFAPRYLHSLFGLLLPLGSFRSLVVKVFLTLHREALFMVYGNAGTMKQCEGLRKKKQKNFL